MRLLGCLLLAFVAGCDDPCPNGSMTDSPGGLVAVQEEHPEAWGEAEACTSCHSVDALHLGGCTEGVDAVALREQVQDEGEDSCRSCHGSLGSEQ